MTRKMLAWTAALAATLAMSAACGSAQDLQTVTGIYEKSSEEIRDSYGGKFDALQQQYRASLKTLLAAAQNSGDPVKTSAAAAEIERFGKMRTLPAEPVESEIDEIKALQSTYVRQYGEIEKEMIARFGGLTQKYGQALDRLRDDLIKAGKRDDADAVIEEYARAKRLADDFADQFAALKAASVAAAPASGDTAPERQAQKLSPLGAHARSAAAGKLYLVIDLSAGQKGKRFPVEYTGAPPKDGWNTDLYKTTKLVMRRVPAGTFMMGSPGDELGRRGNETRHKVTLTKDFYVGIFEVTQAQWRLIAGTDPSRTPLEIGPVELLPYNDIRGARAGAGWPAGTDVDADSFLGILRAKTGLALDLPTEAQWEYACRAGTATALNSGKNLTARDQCGNLAELGRYSGNRDDGRSNATEITPVGSYLPNAWGLYDMHGNRDEWCLDWWVPDDDYGRADSVDPAGPPSGRMRVTRGGSCWLGYKAADCRSARRNGNPTDRKAPGVRIVWTQP